MVPAREEGVGSVNPQPRHSREGNGTMAYFVSIGILISVLFSIAALTISLQPEAEAKVVEPFLVVEDVYFVLSSTTGSSDSSDRSVTMTAYITNQGKKEAAAVEVRVFAIDTDTNLGVDYNQATIGLIPADTTGETTLSLLVPQGKTYRVEMLVFESGKIVVRGSGSIKLIGSTGSAGEDFTTDSNSRGKPTDDGGDGDIGLTAMSKEEAGSSGLAIVALAISVLVIISILAAAMKSKPTEKDNGLPKVQNTQTGATPGAVPSPEPTTKNDAQPRKLVWEQGV